MEYYDKKFTEAGKLATIKRMIIRTPEDMYVHIVSHMEKTPCADFVRFCVRNNISIDNLKRYPNLWRLHQQQWVAIEDLRKYPNDCKALGFIPDNVRYTISLTKYGEKIGVPKQEIWRWVRSAPENRRMPSKSQIERLGLQIVYEAPDEPGSEHVTKKGKKK